MRVYFDKENVVSFIKSKNNEKFDDCLRMIKSQCDLFFTFQKELLLKEPFSNFVNVLTSGRGETLKLHFEADFPERPLKTNIHKDFDKEQITAIYLLDDCNVDKVKKRGAILIGGVGEEIDILSKLYFDDFQFIKQLNPKNEIASWHSLDRYMLPCSDIIIVDRFLFSDVELLDYNLLAYLGVISRHNSECNFNLVIFTDAEQQIVINGRKETIKPEWDKLCKKIKNYFKNKNRNSSVKVTIVAPGKIGEHDRTVFTNYSNHVSGDSLNYFDSNGHLITKGRHYAICSHGLRSNLLNSFSLIDHLQELIDNLSDPSKSHCINGDKQCSFLKFL